VEALLAEELARCVEMASGVWEVAKAKAAETSRAPRLVLNGGCCRMPKLQAMLNALQEEGEVGIAILERSHRDLLCFVIFYRQCQ
jgi:molecular chaperone DnaK (HSP70)